MKNTHHNKKGFTLIETMVAISVLMFAILGPLSIASSSLTNARIARDQVTAFYLAQEGLEFVRYTRDTNYLNDKYSTDSSEWKQGLSSCFSSNGCQADVAGYFASGSSNPQVAISACGINCAALKINSATGLYTYSSSDVPTSFVRKITLEQLSNTTGSNNEIKATVTVSWSTGAVSKRVQLSENIRNIYGFE